MNNSGTPPKIDILVIDDDPTVADALKLVLEANGYAVYLAATGRAGIKQARRRRFDLGVVDLGLPDKSGIDVIRTIRELQSWILVILITAQSAAEVLGHAQSFGPVEILLKPFRPEELLSLISNLLG